MSSSIYHSRALVSAPQSVSVVAVCSKLLSHVWARAADSYLQAHNRRWEGVSPILHCVRPKHGHLGAVSKCLNHVLDFLHCANESMAQLTLIFAVASLHLLMHSLLHFSLQDPRSRRLVVCRSLQDVRCIDPVVYSACSLVYSLLLRMPFKCQCATTYQLVGA
jgi:hypothetical protein